MLKAYALQEVLIKNFACPLSSLELLNYYLTLTIIDLHIYKTLKDILKMKLNFYIYFSSFYIFQLEYLEQPDIKSISDKLLYLIRVASDTELANFFAGYPAK